MEILLPVILALFLLIGAGLGIAAFVRTKDQARSIARLHASIEALRGELAKFQQPAAREETGGTTPEAAAEALPELPATMAPEPPPIAEEEVLHAEEITERQEPAPEVFVAQAPERTPAESIEQRLTSRWLLWLGALTLALGGAFLVKYAIDEGWLGPTARVAAGFAIGCVLMGFGEWLRERPERRASAALRLDYIPAALTAGGVSIAYSSAYAAFELYDLLPPLAAFGVLGVLSFAAILLALLHGPLIALLGILGGFATPLLISSDNPSAAGLFLYLLFVIAAAFTVVRFTGALWLALAALAGAVLWPLLWFATAWQNGDAAMLGVYLLLTAPLAILLPSPGLLERQEAPIPPFDTLNRREAFAWVSALCIFVLTFILLRQDGYGWASLSTLIVLVCLSGVLAWRAVLFDLLAAASELLVLAALAAWHMPALLAPGPASPRPVPPQTESVPPVHDLAAIVPPEPSLFLTVAAGFAALFGVVGFVALWRARRPVVWAAISATAPVLLLTIAYWRVEDFGLNLSWCLIAVALAAANVLAASRFEKLRGQFQYTIALAGYAAAATAALALGATMALQLAWLTVAFSVEVAALAWIALRLDLAVLRPIAGIVAGIVLARLLLNYNLFDYPVGSIPLLNWMLYGYGIPCLAFLLGAIWLRRMADDAIVMLLEAGALVFAVLLVMLEIHNITAGSLQTPPSGLLEPSLQSIAWLCFALALSLRVAWIRRVVLRWGARLLAALAVGEIVINQVVLENPLWSNDPVGRWPVLNLLLLAYGIPALLLLLFGRLAIRDRRFAWGCFVLSLALLFIDVSLELRHWFQGPVLSASTTSDAEWYCYSAIWLAFAGLLLVLGIRSGSIGLRYGSLGVLLITVGKVFLSDMADLTGLYRVASFFGLGLCLIGVGYLYQRFVFPVRAR